MIEGWSHYTYIMSVMHDREVVILHLHIVHDGGMVILHLHIYHSGW